MKKIIKAIIIILALVFLLPALVFLGRIIQCSSKIDIRDGNECWNIPPSAKHIYAKGSQAGFAAQFHISESNMVAYARSRAWTLMEITNQVDAMTYLYFDNSSQTDDYTTVSAGLIFDNMSHRGGFIVIFNRNTRTGYIQYGGW